MNQSSSIMSWEPLPRMGKALRASGLLNKAPVALARAPGRLDVMGGIADYSGSLVCEMPLAIAAGVAVQAREDGRFVVHSAQEKDTVAVDAAGLGDVDAGGAGALLHDDDAWARYLVGCAWWLMHNHSPASARAGATIFLDSDVPSGGGVSSSAAIEVAAMTALAKLWDVALEPMALAVACQAVENRVVGAPCGVMDQVTAALGQQGSMLEILCQVGNDGQPAQVLGQVQVPEGYMLAGLYSGVRHEVRGDPYTDTRVAAFMAQKILSTHQSPDPTSGHLANVDADLYRDHLRTHLPETITGQAFLNLFASTNDPVTTVQPDRTYAVRSAADHHVLEMSRVRTFVELLREQGPHDMVEKHMQEAGMRMYESHTSYSKCANLGHPLTDRLVDMVQERGTEQGFYGAKITGGGCGGTVAILMRDDEDTRAAVAVLAHDYEEETGRSTLYFEGTSPGAAELGAVAISPRELP
ncbi:MAG: hypothetical protein WD042_14715 [Phycisphaeraceae bacterium]